MALTPAQRKELRTRAHTLKPVIMVGDAGISETVVAETNRALTDHELIKVRLSGADRLQREQMAAQLCEQLGAQQVQAIGHIRVLYRANPLQAEVPVKSRRKKKSKGSRSKR
jgi:RNA-binding protein